MTTKVNPNMETVTTTCGDPFDEDRCRGCSSHFDCFLDWACAQSLVDEINAVNVVTALPDEDEEIYEDSKSVRRVRRKKEASAKRKARLLSCGGDKNVLEMVMELPKEERRARPTKPKKDETNKVRFPVNPYRGKMEKELHENRVASGEFKHRKEKQRLTSELIAIQKEFCDPKSIKEFKKMEETEDEILDEIELIEINEIWRSFIEDNSILK